MNRILVAEDDQFFSSLIALKLRKEGFDVACAYDGEEALTSIAAQRPDLILLDLLMPKKDGYEVMSGLQQVASEASPIPIIIVMSNLSDHESTERAKAAGASEFMIKANTTPGGIVEKVIAYLAK